jgi:hypothetical protein
VRARLLRILAWIVTGGLLFLLFRRIPFGEVVATARGAAGWGIPVAVALTAVIYVCDTYAIWKTFGWFVARMSFADVLRVRGATYLFAAINYNVGQGAIVYFVHRTTGAPVMRGIGTILLVMGVNVLALLFLATAGLVAAPQVPHAVPLTLAVAYLGLAVYVIVLLLRPAWLVKRPLFDVLLGAGIGGHLRALVVRVPHVAMLYLLQICLFRAFHLNIPIGVVVSALPIVFLIAGLPISVQGLGTSQAAMIYFFARYAPGDRQAQQAALLAASLAGQTLVFVVQALIGLVCMQSQVGRSVGNRIPD